MENKYLKQDIIRRLHEKPENYATAKNHAALLDQALGFDFKNIEDNLYANRNQNQKTQEFWLGLDIQSLQTPYSEIMEMIEHIKPTEGDRWFDLGAGYGRMGLVLGILYPEVKFIGYEYVFERVAEGNRVFKKWSLDFNILKQADLSSESFNLEYADVYFIYDFGSKKDVYAVLEKLRQIASQKKIKVIARGRGMKNWLNMDFPWLSQINEPEHFNNWSLYRS